MSIETIDELIIALQRIRFRSDNIEVATLDPNNGTSLCDVSIEQKWVTRDVLSNDVVCDKRDDGAKPILIIS